MSTRGAMGFRIGGKDKVTYNHWDSYPAGAGLVILRAIRAAGEAKLTLVADDVQMVERVPKELTYEDFVRIIDTGKGALLELSRFLQDSLFCEWAYIINVDEGTFEVYRGFNKDPKAPGRYAGKKTKRETSQPDYCGVRLVKTYALAAPPSDAQFEDELTMIEKEDE